MLTLITQPISILIVYALNKPYYTAIIHIFKFAIMIPTYIYFIPKYGAIGMAIIFGILLIGGQIIENFIVYSKFYKTIH